MMPFRNALFNRLWSQHKAGLAVALICGMVIGSGLKQQFYPPTPGKDTLPTPMMALFESAGWAANDRYITKVSPQTEATTSLSALLATAETAQQTRSSAHAVSPVTTIFSDATPRREWLPATEALLQRLREGYGQGQLTPTASTAMPPVKVAYQAESVASLTVPGNALAVPAVASDSLLRSVVSTSAARVEITHNKAVVLNLASPITRVTISNPAIASATLISPTEIQLVGKALGVANVILWPSFGGPQETIDVVVHRDLSLLRGQLKQLDSRLDATPADDAGAVAITGNVDSADIAQQAIELAQNVLQTLTSTASTAAGLQNSTQSSQQSGQGGGSANGQVSSIAPIRVVNLVRVNGAPTSKLSVIRQRLKGIHPNIRLDIVRGNDNVDKAVLSGHVPRAEMVSQAINTTAVFYGQPGIKVVTGPGGNGVASQSTETFQTGDSFSSNMATNVLQGTMITDASGNVVSLMTIAERPQVRLTIRFLEINRNDLNQLGLAGSGVVGTTPWASLSGLQGANRSIGTINVDPTSGSNLNLTKNGAAVAASTALGLIPGQGVTQVFSLGREGTFYLSALVEKRQVRSLAEPTLTMLSGEKSSFLAGGEVPVPVSLINGQISVDFKEFGIRMNVVPTVIDDTHLNLQVAPEVSTVDTTTFVAAGGLNIPGFRTRRMQTTLEVLDGEQIVLAGLFSNEDIRVASGFPFLSDIPFIGSLFRNRNRDADKTEMIVLIRPEIVKRTANDPEMVNGDLRQRTDKLEDALKSYKNERDTNLPKTLLP